jgi:hypothetical protein
MKVGRRVPEDVIERMAQLKKEYKTLEEIQGIIETETGVRYSIGTISNRIRRQDEKTFRVHLSETEQQSLIDNYGSVGKGINQAVRELATLKARPKDPFLKKAYIALLELSKAYDNKLDWKTMTEALQHILDMDYDEAAKTIGRLKAEGFIGKKDNYFWISDRRIGQQDGASVLAAIFGSGKG